MIPPDAPAESLPLENDFAMANRAYELFTLAEREQALERFAALRYPSIRDRFFEAVHAVIVNRGEREGAADGRW